jgi:hypothetical protein
MRDALRGLPAMSASDDLADRVLRSAERAMFTGADQSDSVQSSVEDTESAAPRQLAAAWGDIALDSPRRSSWLAPRRRGLLWAAAAVAAALVVFVSTSRDPDEKVALAPDSDSRLEESELARPTEPTDRSEIADISTATTELESFGRSGRENVLGKAAPASGDTLSSETVPSDTPTAAPRMKRAGKAGAGDAARPRNERDVPRYAKDSSGPFGAESETNGRGYGGGGYGDGRHSGDAYGAAGTHYFLPADEQELKEQFATAAASRTVYVVYVDVPADTEGGEQLNVLLAKQQIMTVSTGASAVGQSTSARERTLSEAIASDGDANDNGIDAESVAVDEPRYYYAEMTPAQLQAAVVDMRSQREVFSNVALSDVASNRIDVESLAEAATSNDKLKSLADAGVESDDSDGLPKLQTDRFEGAAGNFAAPKPARVVESLEQHELNYSTSEVLPIDQGAVVDLGQRAGSRRNLDGSGRQLSRPSTEEELAEIFGPHKDTRPREDVGFEENGVVDTPVTDRVVQQVIVEGQQALSEWRFENVIVGQQSMPAARAPAMNAPIPNDAAAGNIAAETVDRALAGSADGKEGDDAQNGAVTDTAAAPSRAIGVMRQRRSGGQAPRRSSLSRSQQAGDPTFGTLARQQDAGLVGTLFILRHTDRPSAQLRPADEHSTGEPTSDRTTENHDDSEATGESDKSAAAEPTGASDE